MSIQIIDTGIASPEENMAKDMELLDSLSPNPQCLIHFYEWNAPAATYGYFSCPSKLLKPLGVAKHGLSLARRPTGGGLIFHQYDLAFSILLSASHPHFSLNTLNNYRFINTLIARAISQSFNLQLRPQLHELLGAKKQQINQFCMAQPTIYDLVIDGKKVAGAAQRRTKLGFLHQGSISLQLPKQEFLDDLLFPESGIAQAMQISSYPLLADDSNSTALKNAREILKKCIVNSFL